MTRDELVELLRDHVVSSGRMTSVSKPRANGSQGTYFEVETEGGNYAVLIVED